MVMRFIKNIMKNNLPETGFRLNIILLFTPNNKPKGDTQ